MTTFAAATPPRTRRLAISGAERALRRERVLASLDEAGLDGLVLFHPERIGYLTNFVFVSTERPMALVIPRHGDLGILIPRLEQEHVRQAPEIEDVEVYAEYPGGDRHPMQHLSDLL